MESIRFSPPVENTLNSQFNAPLTPTFNRVTNSTFPSHQNTVEPKPWSIFFRPPLLSPNAPFLPQFQASQLFESVTNPTETINLSHENRTLASVEDVSKTVRDISTKLAEDKSILINSIDNVKELIETVRRENSAQLDQHMKKVDGQLDMLKSVLNAVLDLNNALVAKVTRVDGVVENLVGEASKLAMKILSTETDLSTVLENRFRSIEDGLKHFRDAIEKLESQQGNHSRHQFVESFQSPEIHQSRHCDGKSSEFPSAPRTVESSQFDPTHPSPTSALSPARFSQTNKTLLKFQDKPANEKTRESVQARTVYDLTKETSIADGSADQPIIISTTPPPSQCKRTSKPRIKYEMPTPRRQTRAMTKRRKLDDNALEEIAEFERMIFNC